jgi:SAM-dependent MidA family methyltransferase
MQRTTLPLRDRILGQIRDQGPITFAAFMEAALYDPAEGFYARPPVGEGGHFVTSPHVSPAFGELTARQVAETWDLQGRPRPFTVVEVGAGDGTLAGQILRAVSTVPDLAEALRYVGVERSPGAMAALQDAGIDAHDSLPAVGAITGCVIGNEVLDNVPFHRLRELNGRAVEVFVGAKGDRLVEMEAEAPAELVSLLDPPLRPGEERPVSPAALELIREVAAALARGYAFFFDYGFGGEITPGPVHAYREHTVLAEVLDEPGSRDVTAAVDLDALAAEGRRSGLQVWGPVPQREALLALGYRMWAAGVRRRQSDAEARESWLEANRLYEARSRASILIDPGKLGGLSLLAFATEGLPPPMAVLGDRQSGC